jgi:transposase
MAARGARAAANDAEAICEAVRRPTVRFVRVKSAEQQSQLMQHRTRDLLLRQRTQVINALRARRNAECAPTTRRENLTSAKSPLAPRAPSERTCQPSRLMCAYGEEQT